MIKFSHDKVNQKGTQQINLLDDPPATNSNIANTNNNSIDDLLSLSPVPNKQTSLYSAWNSLIHSQKNLTSSSRDKPFSLF